MARSDAGGPRGTLETLERSLTRYRRLRNAHVRLGFMSTTEHSNDVANVQAIARRLCSRIDEMIMDMNDRKLSHQRDPAAHDVANTKSKGDV